MVEFALLLACLEHGTDHDLVRAIATHESRGEPTALHINRWSEDQFRDLSLDEAVAVAEQVLAAGYTIDVGLMGINSTNFIDRFGLSIREAFDPCTNIHLGEQILFENTLHAESQGHAGDDIVRAALSLYNTGSLERGFANGYVEKVWGHYITSMSFDARESTIDVPWNVAVDSTPPEREQPTWIGELQDE